MITHDELLKRLTYNPETGAFIWKSVGKWQPHLLGKEAGVLDSNGYRVFKLGKKLYKAHRVAWFYMTGGWPVAEIDHINRIRSDNRFVNLRLSDHLQNAHNKGPQTNSRSGHTGVYYQKSHRRWRAYIYVNKKNIHLGQFERIEDAIAARAEGKARFHTMTPPAAS